MQFQSKFWKIGLPVLTGLLWLLTFVLGLQLITSIGYLLSLLFVMAGGSIKVAAVINWPLTCVLAIGLLAFTIFTGEYHRKRVGKPESWRLFAWSIGIEVLILLLHYFFR